MWRGIIHFHSKYSFDSILSLNKIVKFAIKKKLNFLCLTDHNTIKGALELKKIVNKKNIPIEIIIGAEYKTNLGDIIALNIMNEIYEYEFNKFVNEVKKQNGLILFPHPFKGHDNIEYIASKIDLIEVFNSRVSSKDDEKAFELANKFNKRVYYASDAHNYLSLKNVIIEFEKFDNFYNSLLNSYIKPKSLKKSFYFEIIYSQILKSFKKRDFKVFLNQIKSIIKLLISFRLYKRIN